MIDITRPLVRFAVVSDIHAFSARTNAEGSLLDYSGAVPGTPNPLTDLIQEVKKQKAAADFLVCAGDICNRADAGGLERAWKDLHCLRDSLGASRIMATCGNHDLDSRFLLNESDPDPKGALLSLDPRFPFDDLALTDQFWARNYAVVTHSSGVVLVSLNTSAYHGGKQEEILHGRVSKRTIASLSAELKSTRDAPAHVLICHHHPLPMRGVALAADGEYIRNGQELMDEIILATGTSWLIVHGHRHKPRLVHGASSTNAVPFVLGSGSLGARIAGVPNQFHMVSIYPSALSDHASIVGIVETWSWTDSTGWNPSCERAGLPPICGFGYRGQIKSLSTKISEIVGNDFAPWDDIRSAYPAVDFLMPDALIELENDLAKLGMNVQRGRDGRPAQVGK